MVHTLAAVGLRHVHTQLAARPALSFTALVHVWHAHTHTHTHTHMRTHTHTRGATHADAHTHTYTHPHVHTHIATNTHTRTHARTRAHTHTHTHKHDPVILYIRPIAVGTKEDLKRLVLANGGRNLPLHTVRQLK